jgi:Zn-dependent protease
MAAGSLKIGNIFGINVELHWSFILLLLFTLILQLYLGFAIIVLLFVCVFVHELAHSVTSLRNGIKVKEIVLLPIGGISNIDAVKMKPDVEFNVAIAGPITSLFIGGLFGMLSAVSPIGIITFIFQWMFILNIFLGIFNILPAFPMDGGRVLRGYLERKHNEFDATMLTVRISTYIIALFLIGSFIYIITTNVSLVYKETYALIYLFIAFWLYGGAQAEKQTAILRKDTAGLNVSRAISKGFIIVKPNTTVKKLYSLFKETNEHIILTKINGGYGLVDLFRRRTDSAKTAIDLAIPIIKIPSQTNVVDAVSKINDSGIALVVQNDKPIGIITPQRLQALISLHIMNKIRETKSRQYGF